MGRPLGLLHGVEVLEYRLVILFRLILKDPHPSVPVQLFEVSFLKFLDLRPGNCRDHLLLFLYSELVVLALLHVLFQHLCIRGTIPETAPSSDSFRTLASGLLAISSRLTSGSPSYIFLSGANCGRKGKLWVLPLNTYKFWK